MPAPDQLPHTPAIGRMLIEAGLIGEDDLAKALAFQAQFGGRLGGVLVRMGTLAEERLLAVLSAQLGLPVLARESFPTEPGAFRDVVQRAGIEPDWWLDQAVLAFETGHGLFATARDPIAPLLVEVVERAFPGTVVHWHLSATQDLDRSLDLLRHAIERESVSLADEVGQLRELAEGAPVVELVQNTLAQAAGEGASDIHVEPGTHAFVIRFRLDGVLQKRLELPRARFDAVASRLKLMAGLDIAERRLPQDGRFSLKLAGKEIDVRVSALPGTHGESLVLRLLPKERQSFRLELLGMEPDTLQAFQAASAAPDGIVLVTGPTGSGKSTTLYATIESIDAGEDKIITVEDPVEYDIPGVSQVQVLPEIGYGFARVLRSILRQDPDIIMIGEIRDLETAEIAVQAALTGHLVFSTLHTNNALGAITRLVDLGVEPFLVATSVRLVAAQRLVRKLCPHCAVADEPGAAVVAEAGALGIAAGNWQRPAGCSHCQGTGYRGRLGLYEVLPIDSGLHDAIVARAPEAELHRQARLGGARTLRDDGLIKASRGETSLAEVLRVTGLRAEA